MEGGEAKVALSMPAGAALDLDNIIPEDVLERIRHSQEVDIVQVIAHIRRNGIVPQDLFAFDDGPKSYRVVAGIGGCSGVKTGYRLRT